MLNRFHSARRAVDNSPWAFQESMERIANHSLSQNDKCTLYLTSWEDSALPGKVKENFKLNTVQVFRLLSIPGTSAKRYISYVPASKIIPAFTLCASAVNEVQIVPPYNLPWEVRTLHAKFDQYPPTGLNMHSEHTHKENFIYIDCELPSALHRQLRWQLPGYT